MNKTSLKRRALPPIPDKLYFTISEAAVLCGVKAYVLRYWEQEFRQLKPVKRRGRRYYQHQDIQLIRQIRGLLYDQGFTIDGARGKLIESPDKISKADKDQTTVKKIIAELETVLHNLQTEMKAN